MTRPLSELIQLNDSFCLSNLDESGQRKQAPEIKLSHKSSQFDNLEDTLKRMWIQSDPVVNIERRKAQPYCKYCEISVVESLFL